MDIYIGKRVQSQRTGNKGVVVEVLRYGAPKTGNVVNLFGAQQSESWQARIVLEDGARSQVFSSDFGMHKTWTPLASDATEAEVQQALEDSRNYGAKVERQRQEAAAAHKAACERLAAEHPELEREDHQKYNGLVVGARNIRKQLKAAFPGVKFSVRSESYSGGCSISVSWQDGPTGKQVEEITNSYKEGYFDGMSDCYEYSKNPWTDTFGGAKYVTTRRDASDDLVQCAIVAVADQYGVDDGEVPTVQQFRQGNLSCKAPNGKPDGYFTWQDLLHQQIAQLAA